MAEQIAYVGETAGDEFLNVNFYKRYVEGTEFSEGGEVEFVRIEVPGDNSLVIDVPVDENHKQRFHKKWKAYQELQSLSGTELAQWDELPDGLRREFEYRGFRYVEQIAGMPDSIAHSTMGGVQWRKKANDFLNRGKVSSDDLISKQQQEIEELKAQMAEILAAKRKKKPEETAE